MVIRLVTLLNEVVGGHNTAVRDMGRRSAYTGNRVFQGWMWRVFSLVALIFSFPATPYSSSRSSVIRATGSVAVHGVRQ